MRRLSSRRFRFKESNASVVLGHIFMPRQLKRQIIFEGALVIIAQGSDACAHSDDTVVDTAVILADGEQAAHLEKLRAHAEVHNLLGVELGAGEARTPLFTLLSEKDLRVELIRGGSVRNGWG